VQLSALYFRHGGLQTPCSCKTTGNEGKRVKEGKMREGREKGRKGKRNGGNAR